MTEENKKIKEHIYTNTVFYCALLSGREWKLSSSKMWTMAWKIVADSLSEQPRWKLDGTQLLKMKRNLGRSLVEISKTVFFMKWCISHQVLLIHGPQIKTDEVSKVCQKFGTPFFKDCTLFLWFADYIGG